MTVYVKKADCRVKTADSPCNLEFSLSNSWLWALPASVRSSVKTKTANIYDPIQASTAGAVAIPIKSYPSPYFYPLEQ